MLNVKINIGFKTSHRFTEGTEPTLKTIMAALVLNGICIGDYDVKPSDSEPTFTAECMTLLSESETKAIIAKIATQFKQDCIAAIIGDKGHLLGEYDYKWGEFDMQYFVPLHDKK